MDMVSLQGKTNFFEKRVGEYALSGVGSNVLIFQSHLFMTRLVRLQAEF